GADREDDRRRGDDRVLRRARADGVGRRLPGAAVRAAAPADRHPLRLGALPRWRLLRPGGEPRFTRGRAGGRARGPRDPRRGRPGLGAPRVRAHRRGAAEGLLAGDGALPGPAAVVTAVEERARATRLLEPGRPVVVLLS